jgi:hypothetical protein
MVEIRGVGRRLRRALLLAILGVIVTGGATPAIAAANPIFAWSPPRLIDNKLPLGQTQPLHGVACPSAALCVAAGSNVFTSTDPTGGMGSWRRTEGVEGQAVSCPSVQLCVVASGGQVLTSTDPANGAWTASTVDAGNMSAGTCPSASLCVATGYGSIIMSTAPTGGASAWHAVAVDAGHTLSGISCPSTTFCAAVDESLHFVDSTNPAGGAHAWRVTNVNHPIGSTNFGLIARDASLRSPARLADSVLSSPGRMS